MVRRNQSRFGGRCKFGEKGSKRREAEVAERGAKWIEAANPPFSSTHPLKPSILFPTSAPPRFAPAIPGACRFPGVQKAEEPEFREVAVGHSFSFPQPSKLNHLSRRSQPKTDRQSSIHLRQCSRPVPLARKEKFQPSSARQPQFGAGTSHPVHEAAPA